MRGDEGFGEPLLPHDALSVSQEGHFRWTPHCETKVKVGSGWRFSRDVIEKWVLDKMNVQTPIIEQPGPRLMDSRRRRTRAMNTKGRKSKVS